GMIVAWDDVVDVGGGAVAVGVVLGGLALVVVAVEGRGAEGGPVVGESRGASGAVPGHGCPPPDGGAKRALVPAALGCLRGVRGGCCTGAPLHGPAWGWLS